ncbi:hypothetical protein R69927_06355 [Paraburkholderia domus]|jgi:hypothetical protein|uniref:Uncharacterized protein n=1 Tax=Paraburkholderia domus TaxID=2793075 RepID=A0A9N8N5F3_9BURK|nr:hypothetical protein [Paraburkholderia domus]MBK5053453.1 hypothetical protein [Burkholderia sp. R-70006]MBK5063845.1 hypothetical protein [Burkholderia sp. R-70199]MBK5090381.1 hypothetical protein [Burkholderia sp. R-69927]MBK5124937.1 hypothetical protein [Burkholderia sp. R-69980]MBK5169187.1 hypothetical protein [Burkholderia sp. R-70211]
MAVELPVSKLGGATPTPPRPFVWLTLFVVFMLVGVVSTLLLWPKTEPTGSLWFWTRLLVLPALAWCIAFGLRLHYFDEENDRLRAEEETTEVDRATALRFAQEPLAVLGFAYISALGRANAGGRIVLGEKALAAVTPHSGGKAIRHTAVKVSVKDKDPERYRACFVDLLEQMSKVLAEIPCTVPLNVRLHLPENIDKKRLLDLWKACWRQAERRSAPASLLSGDQGVMALDEWLDIKGGPTLEKFTLFVSVQLHDKPPENSAEAAVAILLGWAPLAERRGLRPLGMLHRPVETGDLPLNGAISKALLWGKADAAQINNLWQAGLEKNDKPALINSASDLSLGLAKADDFAGIHDLDVALGCPGIAAGWLATALAIEHAAQTNGPQLIAWREGSLRLAIAQPMTPAGEAESRA